MRQPEDLLPVTSPLCGHWRAQGELSLFATREKRSRRIFSIRPNTDFTPVHTVAATAKPRLPRRASAG